MKAKTKSPAKKAVVKKSPAKKSAAKKPLIKKAVKAATKKTAAKKSVAKKTSAKKAVAPKAPIRKSVKTNKPAPKKPVAVAVAVKKPVPVKTQTKTAERKAKRAAKAVALPVKTTKPVAPSWPPLITALLGQLDDAKAEEVIAMDLSEKSTIADTMVVATGRSGRHVNAIADQVVEELSKHGLKNIRIEGVPQCDWVLVDAGDVIVHVFRPEVRSFYNLEKLWAANVPE